MGVIPTFLIAGFVAIIMMVLFQVVFSMRLSIDFTASLRTRIKRKFETDFRNAAQIARESISSKPTEGYGWKCSLLRVLSTAFRLPGLN
jgi:hypothetical protein